MLWNEAVRECPGQVPPNILVRKAWKMWMNSYWKLVLNVRTAKFNIEGSAFFLGIGFGISALTLPLGPDTASPAWGDSWLFLVLSCKCVIQPYIRLRQVSSTFCFSLIILLTIGRYIVLGVHTEALNCEAPIFLSVKWITLSAEQSIISYF